MFLKKVLSTPSWLLNELRHILGLQADATKANRTSRVGLSASGGFLITSGILLIALNPHAVFVLVMSIALIAYGLFNMLSALRTGSTMLWVNELSLLGYLTALVALYVIVSRVMIVSYITDTVVGTYMGVLKVLQLQSPYGFSIKPLLDQFGFSPSFYTPGVDGSFDFHLAYPSLSFLSVLPFYFMGLRDLRDSIFVFFLVSVLIVFAVSPAKFKSISLAPFGLFPIVIAASWTDSVWAFFLVLTALLWYRHPKASWVSLGLAMAAKQIAIVVAPFLLIRLLHETSTSKSRRLLSFVSLIGAAFILPNLPFIIASPSAWWSDIVGPYLPNSTPQVPGGIGLSEVLLDLGAALPSVFYLVLVLGSSTFLIYAYARHYRGLNSMVFAFPILLFFLYYRSFPNYMAFWIFPLILEFVRLGGPNLRILTSIRFPSIAWRLPTGSIMKVVRTKMTPSVMLLMALSFTFVGVSGVYISEAATQKTLIQVINIADPDSIGAATSISLVLKNTGPNIFSATFFAKWSFLTYFWESNSTSPLAPGAQATYQIAAPDALSAIPRGSHFRILVSDKLTGDVIGESADFQANIPTPFLANPGLRWWTLDSSVGKRIPFGWKLSPINTDLLSSRISPLGVNGTNGVQMTLNYTILGSGVEQLDLSQNLLLTHANINVRFYPPFGIARDKSPFVIGVTDGIHTLYYAFSNQTNYETLSNYSTNATVLIPTASNLWNTVTINPASVWQTESWGSPQQVTLSLMIMSNSPGIYSASVLELSAT